MLLRSEPGRESNRDLLINEWPAPNFVVFFCVAELREITYRCEDFCSTDRRQHPTPDDRRRHDRVAG
jgi:hypothetical protein